MQIESARTDQMLKRPGRWVLLASIGCLGAALLLGAVAFGSLGREEFSTAAATWLDDHHVWGERTTLLRAAKRYERAHPAADARQAIAAGDVRLLPAAGLGGFFPGLSDDDDTYADFRKRYGEKDLVYAGCMVSSEEESRFRTAAFNYAARYNQAIVAQVKHDAVLPNYAVNATHSRVTRFAEQPTRHGARPLPRALDCWNSPRHGRGQ